jgi:hypothetical protein
MGDMGGVRGMSFASTPPAVASAISRSERCRRREKARLLRRTRGSTWLDAPGVRKRPFLRQDHLVTALSGENAGLVMTLKKDGSGLPSLAYGQHHP